MCVQVPLVVPGVATRESCVNGTCILQFSGLDKLVAEVVGHMEFRLIIIPVCFSGGKSLQGMASGADI